MTDSYLYEINSNLLADKKYFYNLIIFIYIKYYLIIIKNIILEEVKLIFKLKK